MNRNPLRDSLDFFFARFIFQQSHPLRFLFDDAPILPPLFGLLERIPRPPYINIRFRPPAIKPQQTLELMQSKKKNKSDYDQTQGEYWAITGHDYYEANEFQKAIESYNKAIEITGETVSAIFRSRGLVHKKLGNLDQALRDAITAIELDENNIKAHLLCGQVLAEKGKNANNTKDIETAITRMSRARSLCAGQKKQYYEEELGKYIYKAKKLLWYKIQEIQRKDKQEAITNYQALLENSEDLTNQEKEDKLKKFITAIGDPNEQPNFDIPSYLTCKITQELMENPVATSAGQVYEKEMILKYFKTLVNQRPQDPVTHEPITLVLNPVHNIKQATELFLLNNPWAFEYSAGEDYKDIKF